MEVAAENETLLVGICFQDMAEVGSHILFVCFISRDGVGGATFYKII